MCPGLLSSAGGRRNRGNRHFKKIIKICFIYIFPFEIGVEGGPKILSSKLFMANVSYLSSLPSFFGHSLESSVVDPDPNWIRIQELPGSDPHI